MKGNFAVTRVLRIVALLGLVVFGAACAEERTLEDEIRHYVYETQPVSGEMFVAWAEDNLLEENSSREIYTALVNEAQLQAERGHPNAVAVLSVAAQSWATKKRLSYRARQWQVIQQTAIENMRSEPGQLQLWPEDQR